LPGDRGADELDVADFLRADTLQQILVRLGVRVAAEIYALEQLLHHRPHFAELAAETLLERVSGGGIRLVGQNFVDQQLSMQVHQVPP
jgi:hypothetical protein